MAKIVYKCEDCGKEIKREETEEDLICCEKKMKQIPLDICLHPNDPEAARPMRDEEPCDQGR